MGNVSRMDVIYPRSYERKDGVKGTDWLRCGVAWMKPDGTGDIILYTLPVGGTEQPGEVRMVLKPSEGREMRQQGGQQRSPQVQQRRGYQQEPGGYEGPPDGFDPNDPMPF